MSVEGDGGDFNFQTDGVQDDWTQLYEREEAKDGQAGQKLDGRKAGNGRERRRGRK